MIFTRRSAVETVETVGNWGFDSGNTVAGSDLIAGYRECIVSRLVGIRLRECKVNIRWPKETWRQPV